MDNLMKVLSFLEKLKLRRKQIQDLLSTKEEKIARGLNILEIAACRDLNDNWFKGKQIQTRMVAAVRGF